MRMGLLVDLGHDISQGLSTAWVHSATLVLLGHGIRTRPPLCTRWKMCEEKSKEIDFHIYFQSPLTKQFLIRNDSKRYVDFQE